MVYLTKEESEKLTKELSKNKNKQIKDIIKKLKSPEKRRVYVTSKTDISRLLKRAFKEKRKVKNKVL